ncbi:MAG: ABC transporter family substrate-binding protein, partial [Mycobacterium sp.]
MKIRSLTYGLASLAFASALVVSGCSSSDQSIPGIGGDATVGTTNDLNPQDPNTLQQGGNLRLALGAMPANFNPLSIDSEGTGAAMLRATLPRAYTVAPDG